MGLVIAQAWGTYPEINRWEAEAAPAAVPAGLTFSKCYFSIWSHMNHEMTWLVGYTSAINPINFGVKRSREIPEPTGSISFHCLNWTLSMCLPGAVNTAEVEKVGAELRALKEKLKQEAQGKWDALQAQFFDPITLSPGPLYNYLFLMIRIREEMSGPWS